MRLGGAAKGNERALEHDGADDHPFEYAAACVAGRGVGRRS